MGRRRIGIEVSRENQWGSFGCTSCRKDAKEKSENVSVTIGYGLCLHATLCRSCAAKLAEKLDQHLTRTSK